MDAIRNCFSGKTGESINFAEVGAKALDEKVGKVWANAIITFAFVTPAMFAAFFVVEALATPAILLGAAAIAGSAFFPGRDETEIVFKKVVEVAHMFKSTSLDFLLDRVALKDS